MVQGGRILNYASSRKHPVPPPLTAIGRYLQGQTCYNPFANHNFETNKGELIPSNGMHGFCSSSSGGIGGLYDKSEVLLVPSLRDDKILTNHGVFSEKYHELIISGMKTKSKGNNLIKGQWSDEEDRKLLKLVKQHGVRKWSRIAEDMLGRAGKQCRERWHNHLRPNIKKDTWSEEEEILLIEVHRKVGNKWAEIAKLIPGRTENAIKNHWNATKRRQYTRSKTKKNEPKNRMFRPSVLQEYIRSKITANASDHHLHLDSTTTTTLNASLGGYTTISDDSSIKYSSELLNSNYDDFATLDDISQSHDDELTFMQSFFADFNSARQDCVTTSNRESLICIKDPKSTLVDLKPLGLSDHSKHGFASSSSVSYDSLITNSKSSLDMKTFGFRGNLQYGFASYSSILHDDNSSLYSNQEDSWKTPLVSAVYISFLLEGSSCTTLAGSSDSSYYGDTISEMVHFDAQESVGYGSPSNDTKDMDLVEMVLSSQFSHGTKY